MSSGYVLNFSDATIGSFFGDYEIEIHNPKYHGLGTSKAKKVREFWRIEPDHVVGEVTRAMLEHLLSYRPDENPALIASAKEIVKRLLQGKINLQSLKETAIKFDLKHLDRQLKRIEQSIESDPELAIGTSKELIETCCKTILTERSVPFDERNDDLPKLLRLTQNELKLLPNSVGTSQEGGDILKKILGNLGQIGQGITELRNKHGTGHGKIGQAASLSPRLAKLAVASTVALVTFLFESHLEIKK